MLNNSGLEFSWITYNELGLYFPTFTEPQAGEHPYIYFPPLLQRGEGMGGGFTLALQSIQKVFPLPTFTNDSEQVTIAS